MIELQLICPECGKTDSRGKVQMDILHGNMKVECGNCHTSWIMGTPVLSTPIVEAESIEAAIPDWDKVLEVTV